MPFVMVDTSVSLPATLSPRGMARKFWVLLAYGALTYEIEHREQELQELELAAQHGGRVGGLANARLRLDGSGDRHRRGRPVRLGVRQRTVLGALGQ